MKPVQIGNKFHLYRPVEFPPLVKPVDTPYSHGGAKITEADFNTRRQDILDDIADNRVRLEAAQEYRKILEDRFRFTSSSVYDEVARRAYLNTLQRNELIPLAGFRTSKQDAPALLTDFLLLKREESQKHQM